MSFSSIFVGPLIFTYTCRQYFLSVPQLGIYNFYLPSASEYRNIIWRCNGFTMYRPVLERILNSTSTTSKMASESWNFASEEFREFFRNYANVVTRNGRNRSSLYNRR